MRKEIVGVIISMLLFASTLGVFMVVRALTVPPYGGRLCAGFMEDMVESLCIARSMYQTYDSGCVLWPLIYDQLWIMGPAPSYGFLPMLATHWEVQNGGKSWIFHLRDNAKFNDGQNVTAEDVAFTFTYLPLNEPWWYPDCDCEIATVIDTYTVNITLRKPVSHPAGYWMPILPKHVWWGHRNNMDAWDPTVGETIGSGPFKVNSWVPGEWVLLEANTGYWGGRPYVDEVLLQLYHTQEAFQMALEIGEIDMSGYGGISPEVYDHFLTIPNMTVVECKGLPAYGLGFNLHNAEKFALSYKDKAVREAILTAINRTEIVDMVYLGHGEEIYTFVYPEWEGWYNTNLPHYDHNVTKANEILDDAGYVDTDSDTIRNDPVTGKELAFKLMVPSTLTDLVLACEMIREDLAIVGIDITIDAVTYATYETYIYWPTADKTEIFIILEEPAVLFDWYWLYVTTEGIAKWWNCAYYSNATLDSLYWNFTSELDEEKRKEVCREMQMIIAQDLPYIYLFRADCLSAQRTDRFVGYVFTVEGASNWINPWSYYKVHKTEYHWEGWIGDRTGAVTWQPDGKVDMKDIGMVARRFGALAGIVPGYDMHCDINLDGKIDMKDIGPTARLFGKKAPWAPP